MGAGDGQFTLPIGVAVANGSVFVVDSGNNRVERFIYPLFITASAGAGGSIAPTGTITVARGDNKGFVITPDTCQQIADVLVNGTSVGAVASYQMTDIQSNQTISASFEIKTYTITASAGPGGSISRSGQTVVACGSGGGPPDPNGWDGTYTFTPDHCYHVAEVVVDGQSLGPMSSYTFSNVHSDHTISVSFAINSYTITASAGAGGGISPVGVLAINCGSDRTFTMVPDVGHHVAEVFVNGFSIGPVASYTFTNVQSSHTISATFAIDGGVALPLLELPGTLVLVTLCASLGAWGVARRRRLEEEG